MGKEYNPHMILVWPNPDNDEIVAVKRFGYKEDAEDEYEKLRQQGVPTLTLAKVVKAHCEG